MLSAREYMEASADHRPLSGTELADAQVHDTDLPITRREAKVLALQKACPFCHAEAGRKCQRNRRVASGLVVTRANKEPHIERMMLVPAWARRERDRKGVREP